MKYKKGSFIEVKDDTYDEAIVFIAKNLRESDYLEMAYSARILVDAGEMEFEKAPTDMAYEMVLRSWEASTRKWIIFADDEPVAVFGVRELDGEGIPWMLGTIEFETVRMFFARISRGCVKEMMNGYKYLYNYVSAKNKKAIEWLKWCGFNIYDEIPFGPLDLPFRKFDMRV